MSVAGTPDAPTGGTIVDGTYVATSVSNYGFGTTGPLGNPIRQTWVISGGNTIQGVDRSEKSGDPDRSYTLSFTTSGTGYTQSMKCPSANSLPLLSFTATATGFTLFQSSGSYSVAQVYTKK